MKQFTFRLEFMNNASFDRPRRFLPMAFFITWWAVSIAVASVPVSPLASFVGSNGAAPMSGLIQSDDGFYYGTTAKGGLYGCGTIFKVIDGSITTLVSFDQTNGASPMGNLIQGPDGAFYGSTAEGGEFGQGTAFKFNTNDTMITLASFSGSNGSGPMAGLIQSASGNFYGTTIKGGQYGRGTVFRMRPDGVVTTLHSFQGADGESPVSSLILAKDGSIYGTTQGGGMGFNGSVTSGHGTVFRVTLDGYLVTLASFAVTNGANPSAGLVQGADGNFYGTTSTRGPIRGSGDGAAGTIFRVTSSGTITTLVPFWFRGTNGIMPRAELLEGKDGNFYGTTFHGGKNGFASGYGTIFTMTPAGSLTVLATFNGANGASPCSRLFQGKDGNIYGTTVEGGSGNKGSIFKLIPPPIVGNQ